MFTVILKFSSEHHNFIIYSTTKHGESHNPHYKSTVIINGQNININVIKIKEDPFLNTKLFID